MSAPARLAAAFAASLALAASAGCMSVSDDKGGGRKPGPSPSADRQDTVAEPDGGHAGPGGRVLDGTGPRATRTGAEATGDDGRRGAREESRSPSGAGTPGTASRPAPGGGGSGGGGGQAPVRPKPPGPAPTPTKDGGSVPVVPPSPVTPVVPSPEPPVESPTPVPAEPTEEPSSPTPPPEAQAAGDLRMTVVDGDGSPAGRPGSAARFDGVM
ncbi:hypothetical protein [Streptomyces clavuligerus]|uniref:Lipoprotein n=2 Tax=Streptomyces clavuligerus TaxID=1901 RepID=E2PXV4_STRCL|nr:hypothetical protein [Streptomyces clavuligerus]ANW19073.1 hypothetical protein BB341_12975 [Streptomyces clavuligerus]AXU13656.1 hypothetical protein D1794_13450 [Streptomyces clavuligerus]EFG08194.1 Hypothetical protein SCLAV_3123 [Streptomyces clavuligerus]MBY6303624.1 hypothetical protein [Streptomyces clavuligerus]QCS06440.1 hypothetical protein CRV15_12885 [Streptomyces clavuligerus]